MFHVLNDTRGKQGHDSFLFASDDYVNIIKGFIESV